MTDVIARTQGMDDRNLELFYDVYNELGYGFLQSVQENALKIALRQEGLAVSKQEAMEGGFEVR